MIETTALLTLWLILLAGAFVTALWNAVEARRLRSTRKMESGALEEIQHVINHNADSVIQLLNYVQNISHDVNKLNARSEIYDLAFKIIPEFPNRQEPFEFTILKTD